MASYAGLAQQDEISKLSHLYYLPYWLDKSMYCLTSLSNQCDIYNGFILTYPHIRLEFYIVLIDSHFLGFLDGLQVSHQVRHQYRLMILTWGIQIVKMWYRNFIILKAWINKLPIHSYYKMSQYIMKSMGHFQKEWAYVP